ncbi:MAG: hypothetical protein LBJ92_00385 [Holosporales bacterium]|nr:hypothetical protein [Holosporales bacterium]
MSDFSTDGYRSMSFYTIGKNELRGLIAKENRMKMELEKVNSSRISGDIFDMKSQALKHEINLIHNKLKLLTPNSDDDIA